MPFNKLKCTYQHWLADNDRRWGNNPNAAIRDTYNTLSSPLHTFDNRISEVEETYNEVRGIGDHIAHNFKRQKTSHPHTVTQSQDTEMPTLRRRQPKHVLNSRIRRVERMARGELKCFDASYEPGPILNNGVVAQSVLSAIQRGTEGRNRIGDTIHIKKIEVCGYIGTKDGMSVHLIRPNSITTPNPNDFTVSSSGHTYRHEAGWELLKVFRDADKKYMNVAYTFKRPMKVRYDDDVIVLNNLWMATVNTYGSTENGGSLNLKVWFYDN